MSQVVFTGPAADKNGVPIVRADLEAACIKGNMKPVKVVRPGVQLLVASRTDTVKAAAAQKIGVKVITYPEFLEILALMDIEVVRSGKAPDPFVDAKDNGLTSGVGSAL